MNLMLTVVHFIKTYGNDVFQDGNISWPMFWMLYQYSNSALAFDRVNTTNAVALAGQLVMNGDKALPIAKQDRKEAFEL